MFSFFLQLKYFPVKAWENRRESEKKYINIYIYTWAWGDVLVEQMCNVAQNGNVGVESHHFFSFLFFFLQQ